LTGGGCLICAKGYTKKRNVPATTDGFQCITCQSPCSTCIYTPDYCTSCVSGYKFFGWKCAKIFFFSFKATLKVTANTFYSNYETLLKIFAISMGTSDTNAITIFGITFGSVILDAGAAPSGTSGSS
jgi:hypothetical protein